MGETVITMHRTNFGGHNEDTSIPLYHLWCQDCDWTVHNVPTAVMVRKLSHLHETVPDRTPSIVFDFLDAMRARTYRPKPKEFMGLRCSSLGEITGEPLTVEEQEDEWMRRTRRRRAEMDKARSLVDRVKGDQPAEIAALEELADVTSTMADDTPVGGPEYRAARKEDRQAHAELRAAKEAAGPAVKVEEPAVPFELRAGESFEQGPFLSGHCWLTSPYGHRYTLISHGRGPAETAFEAEYEGRRIAAVDSWEKLIPLVREDSQEQAEKRAAAEAEKRATDAAGQGMAVDYSAPYGALGWLQRHADGSQCIGHGQGSQECKTRGRVHAERRCAGCREIVTGPEFFAMAKVWEAHECGAPRPASGPAVQAEPKKARGVHPSLKKGAGKRKVHRRDGSACQHKGARNAECQRLEGFEWIGTCGGCGEELNAPTSSLFADEWADHKRTKHAG